MKPPKRKLARKYHHNKLSDVNIEWINNFPKIIDSNGCWIPFNKSSTNGNVRIMIEGNNFVLSRLSMCINQNIDYNNSKIECRHSTNCSKICFNPIHLKPGTTSDNQKDAVKDGVNYNCNKKVCPTCGSEYSIRINKTGIHQGLISRRCKTCDFLSGRRN